MLLTPISMTNAEMGVVEVLFKGSLRSSNQSPVTKSFPSVIPGKLKSHQSPGVSLINAPLFPNFRSTLLSQSLISCTSLLTIQIS